MKKVIMMLSAMFLAVPMFALYDAGEKVTVKVWNGQWEMGEDNLWRGGVQDIELTCNAPEDKGSYHKQDCYSEDQMTVLYVDDDTQTSAIDNEIASNNGDKAKAKDGQLWVSVTITCPTGGTYVQIQKSQYREDVENQPQGYVRETLSKTVEGVGFTRLERRYEPGDKVDEKNFELFDVHRLKTEEKDKVETDFTRFCANSYIPAQDTQGN